MRTPIWEASAGITRATLANRFREFADADLYTITCQAGPVLRYTTATRDVGYSGTVWSSKQVRIDSKDAKAVWHSKVGLDVDTWQVPVYPRVYDQITGALTFPDKIGSLPFIQAVNGGFLDNAVVTVDRAIFANWTYPPPVVETPVGVYRMFLGAVAAVDFADPAVILNINSLIDRLSVNMPNRLFQASCIHTLFDVGCTLSKAAFKASGTVGGGSTNGVINSGLGAPSGSGTYTLGRMFMTSGKNAPNSPTPGFGRLVRSWSPGIFTLSAPFYFDVQVGDTFDVYPGCDKQFSTCALFANQANYLGPRFIPAPELAI